MPWVKFKLIKKPYYDPRNGQILSSIEGRRNIPNVDPFESAGKVYPEEALKLKILSVRESDDTLMMLIDEPESKINELKNLKGKKQYRLTHSVNVEYNLEDFETVEMTNEDAFKYMKDNMGMSQDITFDSKGVPTDV